MKPKRLRIPSLTLHKSTGRARVRIKGKSYYLGKYGSVEAQEKYEKQISEYLVLGEAPQSGTNERPELTISELKRR